MRNSHRAGAVAVVLWCGSLAIALAGCGRSGATPAGQSQAFDEGRRTYADNSATRDSAAVPGPQPVDRPGLVVDDEPGAAVPPPDDAPAPRGAANGRPQGREISKVVRESVQSPTEPATQPRLKVTGPNGEGVPLRPAPTPRRSTAATG